MATTYDWGAYLGYYGLDPSLASQIATIMASTTLTQDTKVAQSLALIRGSSWYTTTFPGITRLQQLGIVSNEADYRAYTKSLNDAYNQYSASLSRPQDWTPANVLNTLQPGKGNAPTIEQYTAGLRAQSYAQAYGQNTEYLAGAFTPEGRISSQALGAGTATNSNYTGGELEQYGYAQTGGPSTATGLTVQKRIQEALGRYQAMFSGSLASPGLGIGSAGLAGQSLGGQRAANTPDVSA